MTDVPDFALMTQGERVSWLLQVGEVLEHDYEPYYRYVVTDEVSLDALLDAMGEMPGPDDECYCECPWLEPGEEA